MPQRRRSEMSQEFHASVALLGEGGPEDRLADGWRLPCFRMMLRKDGGRVDLDFGVRV